VAGADHPLRASWPRGSELALRIGSALVLAPLAVGTAYVGDWPFALFWGVAAMGVLWEWTSMVARTDQRSVLGAGGAALALAVALAVTGHLLAAVIVLAMGAMGAASLALGERRIWVASGVPYAGALALAPIVLRSDNEDGFLALVFLFVIVWTTDVVAYFSGRAIGGPKLMAQVSPKARPRKIAFPSARIRTATSSTFCSSPNRMHSRSITTTPSRVRVWRTTSTSSAPGARCRIHRRCCSTLVKR